MRSYDRERISELVARTVVGTLFVLLSINLLGDFLRTRHVTGLFLLIGEAMVVVLTIFRRPAGSVDRSARARTVTVLALVGPPLLRAVDGAALVVDEATAFVSIIGVSLVIAGKLTLGRSFGIVPANRGIVAAGPYLLVRHPIYTGYLITHAAFLVAHPSPWNIIVIAISDTALVIRALYEERVLLLDRQYQDYCDRVGWHLVPGVF